MNCPKQQDNDQRNTQQTQKHRQIVARGAENLFQGHFRNGHACQQHSHGADHIADTAQCAGDRGGQRDVQQVQQRTGCNGDQIDIGKELAPFQLGRPLQAGTCMGPEQYQLYNDKGAGVDNIFLPQQGLHLRQVHALQPVVLLQQAVYQHAPVIQLLPPGLGEGLRLIDRLGQHAAPRRPA